MVRRAPGFALVLAAGLIATTAHARRRPLFEPTDLELEDPGIVELDLQYGALRSDSPWRVVVPDVEIDVGLARNVEFDIDGAYAIAGRDDGSLTPDHVAPDNLWVSTKIGLYDNHDDDDQTAWAMGAQLGPKLPVAPDAHGIGYEGLFLVGRTWGETHLVLNLGGFVDPGLQISPPRPVGLQAGLDLDLDLGWSDLSMTAELAGVAYLSDDPNELYATAGITWAESKQLDFSVVGLAGFLSGGDRVGFLVGVSPKFALWR
jgi:hypothetical protein